MRILLTRIGSVSIAVATIAGAGRIGFPTSYPSSVLVKLTVNFVNFALIPIISVSC